MPRGEQGDGVAIKGDVAKKFFLMSSQWLKERTQTKTHTRCSFSLTHQNTGGAEPSLFYAAEANEHMPKLAA